MTNAQAAVIAAAILYVGSGGTKGMTEVAERICRWLDAQETGP